MVRQITAQTDQAKRTVADLSAQASRRVVAQNENPVLIDKARAQLAALEKQLAAPMPPGGHPQLVAAKRVLLEAQKEAASAEILRLESELRYYEASKELFPLEQRLAAVRASVAEERLVRLRKELNRRRQAEA